MAGCGEQGVGEGVLTIGLQQILRKPCGLVRMKNLCGFAQVAGPEDVAFRSARPRVLKDQARDRAQESRIPEFAARHGQSEKGRLRREPVIVGARFQPIGEWPPHGFDLLLLQVMADHQDVELAARGESDRLPPFRIEQRRRVEADNPLHQSAPGGLA